MRAPLRGESTDRVSVSLSGIAQLHAISHDTEFLRLGALVTHDGLGACTQNLPEMGALMQTATMSANPAIRSTATLCGNICAFGFPAADLVPALMALDARLEVQTALLHKPLRGFISCIQHGSWAA